MTWQEYLDALETAVLGVEVKVRHGHVPDRLDLAAPAGAIPQELQARSRLLLALLDQVTEQTQLQHEEVSAELASMPHPRPNANPFATSLGTCLDITG